MNPQDVTAWGAALVTTFAPIALGVRKILRERAVRKRDARALELQAEADEKAAANAKHIAELMEKQKRIEELEDEVQEAREQLIQFLTEDRKKLDQMNARILADAERLRAERERSAKPTSTQPPKNTERDRTR